VVEVLPNEINSRHLASTPMLLAQSNIALSIWPLDDPRMEGFVSRLAAINQLAESSAGFVWRHTDDYDSAGRSTIRSSSSICRYGLTSTRCGTTCFDLNMYSCCEGNPN
jgi:hypothetical protein